MKPRLALALGGLVWGLAAGAAGAAGPSLIGAYAVPKTLAVAGAPFGGVSGIDYDPKAREWLMVSDDRSDTAPARFYAARLTYDGRGVTAFALKRSVVLRQGDGTAFPATASLEGERADAEALRVDPLARQIVWASEGDAARGFDPSVRRAGLDGASRGAAPLPAGLAFDPRAVSGARPNLTVEGLSFAPDGRSLWVSMEAPLIQDGPVSSVRAGGVTRITRLDRQGKLRAQYAYLLDPIQVAPGRGLRADNGVSEILAADDHRLLVLERSGVETRPGHFAFHCRLYLVDTRGGQDVAGRQSLIDGPVRPLAKRLLVNFDRLAGVQAGNLEAMAWGPRLKDGRRTLVLMADDNFDPESAGALLIFAVARL
ncbi:esterase-like activity of phytase family protein [soil metagenome]